MDEYFPLLPRNVQITSFSWSCCAVLLEKSTSKHSGLHSTTRDPIRFSVEDATPLNPSSPSPCPARSVTLPRQTGQVRSFQISEWSCCLYVRPFSLRMFCHFDQMTVEKFRMHLASCSTAGATKGVTLRKYCWFPANVFTCWQCVEGKMICLSQWNG